MRTDHLEAAKPGSYERLNRGRSWEWAVMHACEGPNQKSAFLIRTLKEATFDDPELEKLRLALLPHVVTGVALFTQELAAVFKTADTQTFTDQMLKTLPADNPLKSLPRKEVERRVVSFVTNFRPLRPVGEPSVSHSKADRKSGPANVMGTLSNTLGIAPVAVTPEGIKIPKPIDPKQTNIDKASWLDGLTGHIAKQNVLTDAAFFVGTILGADMVFKTTAMGLTDGKVTGLTPEAQKMAVFMFAMEFAAINAIFTPLGEKLMEYVAPQEGEMDLLFKSVSNKDVQSVAKLLFGVTAVSLIIFDMWSSWNGLPAYLGFANNPSLLAQFGRGLLAVSGTLGLPMFASKLAVDLEDTAAVGWRRANEWLNNRRNRNREE